MSSVLSLNAVAVVLVPILVPFKKTAFVVDPDTDLTKAIWFQAFWVIVVDMGGIMYPLLLYYFR